MSGVSITRYIVIVSVVALTAGSDLLSKHWIERNLATDRHLLPVRAKDVSTGDTAGDVVRQRFPELSNEDLASRLFKPETGREFHPDDRAFPADDDISKKEGFFVFDNADLDGFARRVHRFDRFAIQRWLMSAQPDLDRTRAGDLVAGHLADVTLAEFLSEKLTHLDEDEITRTIEGGLFAYGRDRGAVDPSQQAVEGDIYLVGSRQIVLVPGFLEFDYVENPAGAWGILGGIDENVRRVIFFILSMLAVIVVVALIIRPPTDKVVPLVALGGILGGAIGNMVDRLTLKYVVDFIHMHWQDAVVDLPLLGQIRMDWPRYNIADIGITVGVIVLLITTGFTKEEKEKK